MDKAIILTAGLLNASDAKTAHGLIRESNRFKIVGIIDHLHAGRDAGEVLDGKPRGIPVFKTIEEALPTGAAYCIVGVATSGGKFPEPMLEDVRTALKNGISMVNGLHDFLSERKDIAGLAEKHHARLMDIRKPKQWKDLHFWTGEIFNLKIPVVAVIGTDCSMGKRTTQRLLVNACREAGLNAQLIYTGQTGWLQGGKYGFIFDSTLNDFVVGELENAILICAKETHPDIIILEGQSSLRNPTGPCGAELLVSGNAKQVVLVHSPKREYFHHNTRWGKIPSLATEIEIIKLYGSEVIAIALNTEHCTPGEAKEFQKSYQENLHIPVVLPLQEGCGRIVSLLRH